MNNHELNQFQDNGYSTPRVLQYYIGATQHLQVRNLAPGAEQGVYTGRNISPVVQFAQVQLTRSSLSGPVYQVRLNIPCCIHRDWFVWPICCDAQFPKHKFQHEIFK